MVSFRNLMLELKKSLNILLHTLEQNLQHFEALTQNFQSLPNLNKESGWYSLYKRNNDICRVEETIHGLGSSPSIPSPQSWMAPDLPGRLPFLPAWPQMQRRVCSQRQRFRMPGFTTWGFIKVSLFRFHIPLLSPVLCRTPQIRATVVPHLTTKGADKVILEKQTRLCNSHQPPPWPTETFQQATFMACSASLSRKA